MPNHALLSASSSHRWLHCPPSARLCEEYDDKGSNFAAEGTDVHALCEYKLRTALGMEAKDPTEDLSWYDAEMEESATGYVAFVMELVEEAKKTCSDPVILIEQRLDYSRYVAEGFGTGDCVIIADGTLHIVDFKYGRGILVEAEDNPQMMLYALGALELLDSLYDFDRISMTIFQPRRDNVSTWEIGKDDLLRWAKMTLMPTAQLAYDGKGEFHAGDHCLFCKAKANCRKRAEYNLELARYDFQKPEQLEETEIAAILDRVDQLVAWAEDIKEYALAEALRGVKYDGYKVVEGRSVRKYTDEAAVAEAVAAEGIDPYEKKLRGITDMTALLGKKEFERILGSLIYKPSGKPVLVRDSDRRPEYNTAKSDFEE